MVTASWDWLRWVIGILFYKLWLRFHFSSWTVAYLYMFTFKTSEGKVFPGALFIHSCVILYAHIPLEFSKWIAMALRDPRPAWLSYLLLWYLVLQASGFILRPPHFLTLFAQARACSLGSWQGRLQFQRIISFLIFKDFCLGFWYIF